MISAPTNLVDWDALDSPLIAVPNFSFGPDSPALKRVADAMLESGVRLLDTTSDYDHQRTVYTLAGDAKTLPDALVSGFKKAAEHASLLKNTGTHPRVGLLDVAPIVFQTDAQRGRAALCALSTAQQLASCGLPIFLYGLLAAGRGRAELRKGGLDGLIGRCGSGQVKPDFGPARIDRSLGATLVSARPPLLAFNLELAVGVSQKVAAQIASAIRESSGGLPGVRALAMTLESPLGLAGKEQQIEQISCNVENTDLVSATQLLSAVQAFHPVAVCELIGLASRSAFSGFPADMQVRNLRFLDDALAS